MSNPHKSLLSQALNQRSPSAPPNGRTRRPSGQTRAPPLVTGRPMTLTPIGTSFASGSSPIPIPIPDSTLNKAASYHSHHGTPFVGMQSPSRAPEFRPEGLISSRNSSSCLRVAKIRQNRRALRRVGRQVSLRKRSSQGIHLENRLLSQWYLLLLLLLLLLSHAICFLFLFNGVLFISTNFFLAGRALDLDINLGGAPNFRSPRGTTLNVFGVAQPRFAGIKAILSLLNCRPQSHSGSPAGPLDSPVDGGSKGNPHAAVSKCLWFNTREEPVGTWLLHSNSSTQKNPTAN